MFGARIKIKWEEQLADPVADYITSVYWLNYWHTCAKLRDKRFDLYRYLTNE